MRSSAVINGETIELKKDFLGWRTIAPIKNSDGSTNYFNLLLGGKRGLITLLIYLLLIGAFIYAYSGEINSIKKSYGELATNQYAYCTKLLYNSTALNDFSKLNLTYS